MYRDIPEFALVMIIGQDEISTKSFAKKYFKQEEMVKASIRFTSASQVEV